MTSPETIPMKLDWEMLFATEDGLDALSMGGALQPIADRLGLPLSEVMRAYAEVVLIRAKQQAHAEGATEIE